MSGRPVVWITRPQPGAKRTAKVLAEAGYDPVLAPLTEIRACDPELSPDDAAAFDAVAVTSANALRHAPAGLLDVLSGKPVYAAGDATAAEARSRGLIAAESAEGAVDDLVSLIAKRERPGASILYLCGRVRTGDLERKLAEKDFRCCLAELYTAEIVSYPTEYFGNLLDRGGPDAVLFHSAFSASAFAGNVHPAFPHAFENTMFFMLSARIAGVLPAALKPRVTVSAEPNERALLASLCAALPSAGN